MSNYHDIQCLDCEGRPGAGWDWNHGDKGLEEILDGLPLILAAWPMLNTLDIREFQLGPSGTLSSVEFLVAHAGHRLGVVDEYGKVVKVRKP